MTDAATLPAASKYEGLIIVVRALRMPSALVLCAGAILGMVSLAPTLRSVLWPKDAVRVQVTATEPSSGSGGRTSFPAHTFKAPDGHSIAFEGSTNHSPAPVVGGGEDLADATGKPDEAAPVDVVSFWIAPSLNGVFGAVPSAFRRSSPAPASSVC